MKTDFSVNLATGTYFLKICTLQHVRFLSSGSSKIAISINFDKLCFCFIFASKNQILPDSSDELATMKYRPCFEIQIFPLKYARVDFFLIFSHKSGIFVTGGWKLFKLENLEMAAAVGGVGLQTCLTLPQPSLIEIEIILIETCLVANLIASLFL